MFGLHSSSWQVRSTNNHEFPTRWPTIPSRFFDCGGGGRRKQNARVSLYFHGTRHTPKSPLSGLFATSSKMTNRRYCDSK